MPKPTTTYIISPNSVGTTLGDTSITLGDLSMYLHGYETDPPANQLSDKNNTNYASVSKNVTDFDFAEIVDSWLLNSTVVTLNSSLYTLSGYTTSTTSEQLSGKNVTTYTEV